MNSVTPILPPEGGWPLPDALALRGNMTKAQVFEWVSRIQHLQSYFGERLPILAPQAWAELVDDQVVQGANAAFHLIHNPELAPDVNASDLLRRALWNWAGSHNIAVHWVVAAAKYTLEGAVVSRELGSPFPRFLYTETRVAIRDDGSLGHFRIPVVAEQTLQPKPMPAYPEWNTHEETQANYTKRVQALHADHLASELDGLTGGNVVVTPPRFSQADRRSIDWLIEVHADDGSFGGIAKRLKRSEETAGAAFSDQRMKGKGLVSANRPFPKAPNESTIKRNVANMSDLLGFPPVDYGHLAKLRRRQKADDRTQSQARK